MKAFLFVLLLKTNQYKKNTIGRNNKNSKELKSIFVVDKVWIIVFSYNEKNKGRYNKTASFTKEMYFILKLQVFYLF